MLTITQLAARALCGATLAQDFADLHSTIDGLADYLSEWPNHLERIAAEIGAPQQIVLLGRGPSLASACTGALNLQEAAKLPALGMQSGEFRHGPIEIVAPELAVLVFAGLDSVARRLNRKLWVDLRWKGANALLIEMPSAEARPTEGGSLLMPAAKGIGLPLAEIVPVQLLCLHMAQQAGFIPGTFRHISKVTTEE
jgi:glucosamine--fructose-6-phosphate aminotransferase (isomerizing)